MIVDFEGNRMNPSVVAKALFYHYGKRADGGDPEKLVYCYPKATQREVDLVEEQVEIVRIRMSKQLLGK